MEVCFCPSTWNSIVAIAMQYVFAQARRDRIILEAAWNHDKSFSATNY